MGRIYTAQFNGVAVTAQQDLLSILNGAVGTVLVHEIGFSQSTEVGDAQEEGLSILCKQGATSAGSAGSAPTPIPRDVTDAAAASVARANDTTPASAGTIVTHYAWNWNVRVPFQYIWTPETRPVVKASRRIVFALMTTPADSITMSGYVVFEEVS
jgi:hypothetical protein